MLLEGLLWGLTACLAALEAALGGSWLWGTLYVAAAGAEENPYAAEDAEIAGLLALYLLPLFLAALACGIAFHRWKRKKWAGEAPAASGRGVSERG